MAAPVISSVSFSPSSGWVGIGGQIFMTINADGTGYTNWAITVNNKSVTNFTDNANNTYTVTYTVAEGDDNTLTTIPISVVLDNSGEQNTPFTTSPADVDTPEIKANRPTIVITENAPDPISSDPFTATFTFDSVMTGFTTGDITLTNATLSNFATLDNIEWTATITPTGSSPLTIFVDELLALDVASNGNSASNTISITVDASGADGISVPSLYQSLTGKTLTVQSQLTSKIKDVPVTCTYSVDQNYVTGGNTCDLSLGGRIKDIIDVLVVSNDKGLKIDYVAGTNASNGKLKCRGCDPADIGGAVVGFPELPNASTETNSMIVRLLVRGV